MYLLVSVQTPQTCWKDTSNANCGGQKGKKTCIILSVFFNLRILSCALPDGQAGFRKSRGTRDQIANIHWITETAREF